MHNNTRELDYHIIIEYCGGCCSMRYNACNKTFKLFEGE
jgi:hypothetical protein